MSSGALNLFMCLTLVHFVLGTINWTLLEKFLQDSTRFYNFTNMPIFVGEGFDGDLNEWDQAVNLLNSKAAKYIFTSAANDTAWSLMRDHIKDDLLSVVLCDSHGDKIWAIVDRRLRRLRQSNMIVLLSSNTSKRDVTSVEQVFRKLWTLQFVSVVVIWKNETYNYTPYPELRIFQLCNYSTNPFPAKQKNLQGYKISTPAENDIPRIFFVPDGAGGVQIKGFAYQVFRHFMQQMNISFSIANPNVMHPVTSSVNMSNIIHLIGTQKLEISMHPYVGIDPAKGIMGYPMFKVENCLIIPVQNEIPRYMYLLRPFDWSCWLLVLMAIVYGCGILIWTSPRIQQRPLYSDRFSGAFLESIALLLFLSSTYQVYRPNLRYFLISFQLAVMGFFITSFYCNLLSSFFATILIGDQVDTFESLISSKIPILAKSYEVHMLIEQVPPHLVKKVEKLIIPVNASVQISHLLSFNTSFSYPLTIERWIFLSLQQEYANKPVYRYSRVCFGSPCVGFPMRVDSHLEHYLTQFIMDIQMTGLDNYWLTSDFKHALQAGYVHLIDNVLPFKALDLYSLYMAWCVIVSGWLIAFGTFSFELYMKQDHRVSIGV